MHINYNKDVTDHENIKKIISELGGDELLADIYISLTMYGPQTISQLSRNSKVERTKIYRLLDDMQKFNLIEVELQPNRNIIKASSLASLRPLIVQKQEQLKVFEEFLPELENRLNRQTIKSPLTKVQFYKGKDGAKQMLWNQTNSNTETVSILYQNMQSHTGEDFYLRWAEKCNMRKIPIRSIVGDEFIASQKAWYDNSTSRKLVNWQGRYLSSDIHEITFWTCIYDNVVAYFDWHEQEIYGIEIYNQKLADANKSFFEALWAQGSDLKTNLV